MQSLITVSLAAVVALAVLGSPAVHASPYTYGAAATSSDFFDTFNTFDEEKSATGPAFAEIGSAPDLYAKAQTTFGVNQAAWQATDQNDHQVGALSIWSDQFTFTGGTGTDSAFMSFQVDGVIESAVFAGFFSILRSASAPSEEDLLEAAAASVFFEFVPPAGTTILFYDEGGTPEGDFGFRSSTFSAPVSFTYGEPFYVTGVGGGYVTDDGVADFFSSARFGIAVPAGAVLLTASGTTYASAVIAAVPEPSPIALLAIALAAMCLAQRHGLTAGKRRRQWLCR